jgi:membrane fusion protein, multidrug efflux system
MHEANGVLSTINLCKRAPRAIRNQQMLILECRRMRKGIIILGACVAATLGGAAFWQMQRADAVPVTSAAPPPPVPVVTQRVQVSSEPIILMGIGSVQSYNVVDIHAQVTGTIEKIGFVEGQTVHKGDLIAQLDPRPFQAALQQAEANLGRDEAHLTNAQVNLDRYTPLEKQGFASTQQVTDQQSQVTQLQASVLADKAAIFNAQTQLSYTTITSPIDGVTGIRRVDIGNIIQPSTSTPIVTITQVQPISVVFTLPQNDIPEIQAAMTKGLLKTIAYDENDRTKLDEGSLLLVNNMVNQASGTAELKATFPNAHRALWPGEFVNVELVLAEQPDTISVPLTAVQQGQNGSFVFTIQSDGTVATHTVDVSETLNGRAYIGEGLHVGDTVVTWGQYLLSDGVRVVSVQPGDPRVQESSEASAGML